MTELDDGAEVPELLLLNTGNLPVLLVEGEMLLGGKQNRALNLSVLCRQGMITTLAVSCVESGQWGQPKAASRSAHHANFELRRAKTVSTISQRGAAVEDRCSRSDRDYRRTPASRRADNEANVARRGTSSRG